jgi:PadR family transcriptional regulator, regulatory protein PadR
MANENQFIRGAGMLAVLKVLEGGELYGYAIVEALAKTKGSALHLGQATVYPMLYNLEAKRLVKARWDESGPRPRKYYSLTKAGKARLADDTEEWSAITRAMASLGLERAAWLRVASVVIAAAVALCAPCSGVAAAATTAPTTQQSSQQFSQQSSQQFSKQPHSENATEARARIAARLRELERQEMESVAAQDARDAFVVTGVADEATMRWLEAARPFARELIDSAKLPAGPPLDYSAGFELMLPHLPEQRMISRAMRVLAHDAAIRGDSAFLRDLLCAQVAGVRDVGDDRTLISSLVSTALGAISVASVDGLIQRGAIDRECAKALVDARTDLGTTMQGQRLAAIEMEATLMAQEAGKLAALGPNERIARLGLYGISEPALLADESADALIGKTEAYRQAISEAIAKRDPQAVEAALVDVERRTAEGEFGGFAKGLAPAVGRMFERLDAFLPTLEAQNEDLAALASGAKTPEDFENAAVHYVAAGYAVQALSAEMQRDIEMLRIAPDEMTAQQRIDVRRAIEALRPRMLDRVARATTLKRCVFDSPHDLLARSDPALVDARSLGLLGALRVALFEPQLPGDRPAGAPDAIDACVSALTAVRHLAGGGGIVHALIAQELSRDAAAAITALDAKAMLDDTARARIAAEIVRLDRADPFGLRRGTEHERERIASMRQIRGSTAAANTPFSRERLRNLSPDAIAFLVGVLTDEHRATLPEPCDCPFDGPILDVRGFFDLEELKAARGQADALRKRFNAVVGQGAADPKFDGPTDIDHAKGSALRSLTVTKPVDMQARLDASVADFERLDTLAASRARTRSEAP